MKKINNGVCETVSMVCESMSVGFSLAGTVNPSIGYLGPIFNLLSLPFAAQNQKIIKNKINEICEEVNKLTIKFDNLENLVDKEKEFFIINESKFWDFCLREKYRDKIKIYAKVFCNSINNTSIFAENDEFDIQMDLINSLRLEDILFCKKIIVFFKIDFKSMNFPIVTEEDLLNIFETREEYLYPINHLCNLGLVFEKNFIAKPGALCQIKNYTFTKRFIDIIKIIVQ